MYSDEKLSISSERNIDICEAHTRIALLEFASFLVVQKYTSKVVHIFTIKYSKVPLIQVETCSQEMMVEDPLTMNIATMRAVYAPYISLSS